MNYRLTPGLLLPWDPRLGRAGFTPPGLFFKNRLPLLKDDL